MHRAPDLRCDEASDATSVVTSTSFRWFCACDTRWFVRIVIPASYAACLAHAQDGGKIAALELASVYPAGPPHEVWEVEPGGVFPRDSDGRRIGDRIDVVRPSPR
jgi:hypothetical protein